MTDFKQKAGIFNSFLESICKRPLESERKTPNLLSTIGFTNNEIERFC